MAWLGKFDDFDEFEENFDTKSTFKPQKPPNYTSTGKHQFGSHVSNQQQQQRNHQNTPEVKRLCDITSQTSFVTVTGVIIAKEQQRSVFSKKNVGSERHVVSFTLRDSPSCFVSVTCWGAADFITDISNNFSVGHVVQLKNAQVQLKTANPNDEKFKPWTPVSFQLSVSENQASVAAYTGWDAATYRNTLTIPTRPSNDYYTLEDINISGMSLDGEHINILAAVKRVGQVRHLTTKTGKQTKKCDVVLFDDTCPAFPLDLWQTNTDAALLWTPFETVLFVADVKISFNTFKSSMVASADCKTMFTVDPDTQEAHCLSQFLRTQDSTAMDLDLDLPVNDVDPDLRSITEEFTVEQLVAKKSSMAQDGTELTYYGVVNATLTAFNIDADTTDVVRKMCGRCRKVMPNTDFAACTNPECSTAFTSAGPSTANNIVMEYNIPVALSDHTGTVSYCHLQSSVAETMLSCKPEAFLHLPEEQKTQIKWEYLLEDCNAIFKLRKYRPGPGKPPSVQILSLEKPVYTQNPVAPYQKPAAPYQQQGAPYQKPVAQYQQGAPFQKPAAPYQKPVAQYQQQGAQFQKPGAQYQKPAAGAHYQQGAQLQKPGAPYQKPGTQYQQGAQNQKPGAQFQKHGAGAPYQKPGAQYPKSGAQYQQGAQNQKPGAQFQKPVAQNQKPGAHFQQGAQYQKPGAGVQLQKPGAPYQKPSASYQRQGAPYQQGAQYQKPGAQY